MEKITPTIIAMLTFILFLGFAVSIFGSTGAGLAGGEGTIRRIDPVTSKAVPLIVLRPKAIVWVEALASCQYPR